MSTEQKRSVLLVEADAALRRVITLGLRQQGVEVLEAASTKQAQTLLEHSPSLLIVDVDGGVSSDWSLLERVRAGDQPASPPIVILTWDCSPEGNAQLAQGDQAVCLVKPFDARRLLGEVETLLAAQPQVAAQAAARLLEAPEETPAPMQSIWPLVLAAGLALAVSGLLVNAVMVALGIVVAFGALLLWGFEPGTRSGEASGALEP
jgi:DNA-binding response OmpR family regulator